MFTKDPKDKADKKLLLLHLFQQFDFPLTNAQTTDFVISLELMDYFTLQQYLGEMVQGSMLEYSKSGSDFFYLITPKGREALEYFKGRLTDGMISSMDEAVATYKKEHAHHMQVLSDYIKKNDSEYIVDLKIMENEITLMDLRLSVVSNRQAKEICDRWKNSSSEIYSTLIGMLTGEK